MHRNDVVANPDDLARAWKEIISTSGVIVYVGEVQEEIVASCVVVVVPNLTRGARPYALIENMVTHGDHRRKGYGNAILSHALSSAWEMGCYKVMLLTGRDETLGFYERVGFESGRKTGFVAYPPPRYNRAVQPTGFAGG